MGWWRIDPETGRPAEDARSALSRPGFFLLNAVPGVDDEDAACYLGDGPWDMASTVPAEFESVTGGAYDLSDEQLRELLLRRVVPLGLDAERLLQVVDAFWRDIDGCYEEDWGRPARPPERRWVYEYAVQCQFGRGT